MTDRPLIPNFNKIYYDALITKGKEAADKALKEAADQYSADLAAWEAEQARKDEEKK